MNGNNQGHKGGAGHHRGRPFRGKRLKTALPRPAALAAPLPPAKTAERIAKVMARVGLDRSGPGVGQRLGHPIVRAQRQCGG